MGLRRDADRPAHPTVARLAPSFLRRASASVLLGLAGVAALLLQPVPPAVIAQLPMAADWPPLATRALLALNPALLVVFAGLIGATLAHRAALGSLLAGTAEPRSVLRVLGFATAAGVALGAVLATADALLRPWMGDGWQRLASDPLAQPATPIFGMLYGGLAEEVMLRWGLMSLVAWGLSSLLAGRYDGLAMRAAIVVAAAVFAVAHLPVLAAQVELTPLLTTRTLLLNGAAGVLYGWLYWRHHLEAAMAAHAATHLGLWACRGLVA